MIDVIDGSRQKSDGDGYRLGPMRLPDSYLYMMKAPRIELMRTNSIRLTLQLIVSIVKPIPDTIH